MELARAAAPVPSWRAPGTTAARVFLVWGLAGVVLLSVAGGALRGWVLVALSAAGAVAAGVAARRRDLERGPAPWLFVGSSLLVPSYVLWYPAPIQWHFSLDSPSIADVLFITAYASYVVALGRLVRLHSADDRRIQVLDSMVISVGVGVLVWVAFIAPYLHDEAMGALARAAAMSYPLLDLVLLGGLVRIFVQGRARSTSGRLLAGWLAAQLVADVIYTAQTLRGAFGFENLAIELYGVSFVLLGTALLHPSSAHLDEVVEPTRPSGFRRLVLVAAATLIAPSVLIALALEGNTRDIPIVAALSGVLFALVVLRIGLLTVDAQEHHRIQDQLRASIAEERRRAHENLELLVSLRERQLLSDRLFAIQRKISTRAPLQDVLDAITAGTAELLGDEVVGLRLLDEDDPETMVMVSSVGVSAEHEQQLRRLPVGSGAGGKALVEDRLVVQESYDTWESAIPTFVTGGLQSVMAAPVHAEGRPIGSLVVGTYEAGRRYTHGEQAALSALAEHVSLALNDARTVQAMHDALDRAVHQAMHDELTGLPNRACFYDRAEQALRVARRDGSATAVLLFDLDRFKEINDTLGHRYGDRILCAIGPRITHVLREGDTLARLGGDEFCVLLPQVDGARAATEVARRIIRALEEPFDVDGMNMAIEASCGIAVAPVHGDTADLLLQRSDVAMYVAKRSHVDAVTYVPDLHATTPDRLALLGDLRAAIAEGQLSLHYQPQVALSSGAIQGVEALVRWDHPRLGPLAPTDFIPVAEDSGLIRPLTSWVLRAGLNQLRAWLDDPEVDLPSDFALAVNLSTRSLLDDSLKDEVTTALASRGLPTSMLVLEVTETAIMADPDRAQRLLTDLADAGVRFAIDDFGTGYSSLAALKSLPVHHLKIDKSFVHHMHEDTNDATIVRSVIDLGRTLGLRTIAEGVESVEAWEQLRALGCDAAQGFLLARAMPPDELLAWLRAAALRRAVSFAG